jgi:hypothetical protein
MCISLHYAGSFAATGNSNRMAADERHNNQPKMFGRRQEEDGEEGRKGAEAGCQCVMSASKEGER